MELQSVWSGVILASFIGHHAVHIVAYVTTVLRSVTYFVVWAFFFSHFWSLLASTSWLVRSTPDRMVWVHTLARDIVLCSWVRHFNHTVPLYTQVYKWVSVNLCWVQPYGGLASHPILLVTSCNRTIIPANSHACGLKTLTSCRLTLVCFFLTPDGKMWVVAVLLDTISHVRNENQV